MLATSTAPHSLVHQWETASAHLARSLGAYLDACLKLSTAKVETTFSAKDLVSRIDHTFESLYVSLEQQVAQSRLTLACTRNKLVATFYSVPEEILAEIFTLVVHDRSGCEIDFPEDDIRAYYRRLHTLLAVCSVWRQVRISHAALWTLVPMIYGKYGWVARSVSEQSYERAGNRELHLAAGIERSVDFSFHCTIVNNFRRFRSINAVFKDKGPLSSAIPYLFILESPPNTLDELSLYKYFEPSQEFGLDVPEECEFLTSPPSMPHFSISTIVKSLRILRMKNIHVHWQCMNLPNLVELCVQSVMIGTKADFRDFLLALQTAPQLQKLELISLNTRPNTGDAAAQKPLPVPLPHLRSLHIGDLYADDIETILRSITPVAYQLSLCVTWKTARVAPPGGGAHVGLDLLLSLLQGVKVDTLLIDGRGAWGSWLSSDDLHKLLSCIPLVKTFMIHCWLFDHSVWEILTLQPNNTILPTLRNLHLTGFRVAVNTLGFFKEFLLSHPLHCLTLGGSLAVLESPTGSAPITESDSLVNWLRYNFPAVRIVSYTYIPPEFRSHHWELW